MTGLVDVIHIGFPKTGTTWLQQALIPRMPEIASLGKPYLIDVGYRDALNRLVSCNEYDFAPEAFKTEFTDLNRRNQAAIAEHDIRLISFERLSGELFSGLDSKQLIERVHKVFGEVKIVITIREQVSIIESIYRHYVKSGGALHVREFMYKNRSPSVDAFNILHMLQKFRYDKIISHCRNLFGDANVKVLIYESLVQDGPESFAMDFAAVLGIGSCPEPTGGVERRNKSLSYAGSGVLRILNQVIATPHSDSPFLRFVGQQYITCVWRPMQRIDRLLIAPISPNKRFVDKRQKWLALRAAKRVIGRYDAANDEKSIADDIRRAYAPSNRITAEMIGVDLEKYGYET